MANRWERFVTENKPRLQQAIEKDKQLGPQLTKFIEALDRLGISDAQLARCMVTPAGRAWLLSKTGVRECDVLTWTFAAELMQVFSPEPMLDISTISAAILSIPEEELLYAAEKAVSLIKQSITLRDIKSKSARELAGRRWSLLESMKFDGRPTPAEIADALYDLRLAEYLETQWHRGENLPDDRFQQWLEAHVKGWLLRSFERLKREVAWAELTQLSESAGESEWLGNISQLVEAGVTLDGIKTTPARDLAKQQWSIAAPDLAEGQPRAQAKRSFFDAVVRLKNEADHGQKQGLDLCTIQYYDLLVVSDFHLAAGNQPSPESIARFSPTEDFYFDDAFFRFLYECEKERAINRKGYPYELVFNGDMLDFAQIVVSEPTKDGKLHPWILPPLWLRSSTNSNPQSAQFADRLLAILDEIYGRPAIQDILDQQTKLGKSAGRKLAVFRLASEEWSASKLDQQERKEQLTAQWDRWAEGEWQDVVQDDWGSDQWEDGGWDQADWDDFAVERPPEHWEDWADEEWVEQAEQTWAARTLKEQKVRAMQRKESLGQLADVYFGHRGFFQGLAWFLAQGNRLVLLRGVFIPGCNVTGQIHSRNF